jgi:hypothetical protein
VQVFIDESGLGGGHIDVARAQGLDVTGVIFGARALDPVRHFNLRSECYAKLKEWLPTAALPNDKMLVEDLVVLEYGYDGLGRLQLERKDDLKRRLGRSPDSADALAITFAVPTAFDAGVAPKRRQEWNPYSRDALAVGHDPFAHRAR